MSGLASFRRSRPNSARGVSVVGVLMLAFVGGCSGSILAEINWVYGDPASAHLTVVAAACPGDPSVSVKENETEVRIRIRVTDPRDQDCGMTADVELKEPLGERAVIDEVTGHAVEVFPPSRE